MLCVHLCDIDNNITIMVFRSLISIILSWLHSKSSIPTAHKESNVFIVYIIKSVLRMVDYTYTCSVETKIYCH